MITYTPQTDGVSVTYQLIPGYYKARIQRAEEKASAKGNDMIKLTIWAEGPEGYCSIIEHLVFTEKAIWKVDQFLHAIGREVEPGKPVIVDTVDLIGRECWVKTKERTVPGRDSNGDLIVPYVDRYLRADEVPSRAESPVAHDNNMAEDDIPF